MMSVATDSSWLPRYVKSVTSSSACDPTSTDPRPGGQSSLVAVVPVWLHVEHLNSWGNDLCRHRWKLHFSEISSKNVGFNLNRCFHPNLRKSRFRFSRESFCRFKIDFWKFWESGLAGIFSSDLSFRFTKSKNLRFETAPETLFLRLLRGPNFPPTSLASSNFWTFHFRREKRRDSFMWPFHRQHFNFRGLKTFRSFSHVSACPLLCGIFRCWKSRDCFRRVGGGNLWKWSLAGRGWK